MRDPYAALDHIHGSVTPKQRPQPCYGNSKTASPPMRRPPFITQIKKQVYCISSKQIQGIAKEAESVFIVNSGLVKWTEAGDMTADINQTAADWAMQRQT